MRIIFFHNQHDRESSAALEGYLNDPDYAVEVYDVFSVPPPKIPDNIIVWRYPFVISKQFVVLQPDSLAPQVSSGSTLTVKLGCLTLDGGPASAGGEFSVYVNGVLYNDSSSLEVVDIVGAETPVLTFEFEVSASEDLHLRIEAEEYIPFSEVFKIAVN